jgi:hypothetical protein
MRQAFTFTRRQGFMTLAHKRLQQKIEPASRGLKAKYQPAATQPPTKMPQITSDPFEALTPEAQTIILAPLQSPVYQAYILASALVSAESSKKNAESVKK